MREPRYLIVNADDLGLSADVDRGIAEAHDRGIVTSASLMVRMPHAAAAAAYAVSHPDLSVGLHLDLGEWTFRDGQWVCLYQRAPADDPVAVRLEADRQLELFRVLVGRDPTHLDSHQHAHREEPAREVVLAMARGLGIPVRLFAGGITYCGDFYGQSGENEPLPGVLTVDSLTSIIRRLGPGTTELGCHPGYSDDLDNPYRLEREEELRVLCDPRIRDVLESGRVELRSFADL